MNDPHVVSIRYGMKGTEYVTYERAQPLDWSVDLFDLRLAGEALVATMKCHCPTEESARSLVEPLLDAWEIDSSLTQNRPALRFVYQGAQVIDRAPGSPEGNKGVGMAFCSTVEFKGTARFTVSAGTFPKPPSSFAASDAVKALWMRYRGFLEGKEPLASMAYFCLSLLEGTTGVKKGARHQVCVMYRIAEEVRDQLGDLVSQKGSLADARKMDHEATGVPLSGKEETWIGQVIVALIRRKAEYDANPGGTFEEITLRQFVDLKEDKS